jgi:hypothetical protein
MLKLKKYFFVLSFLFFALPVSAEELIDQHYDIKDTYMGPFAWLFSPFVPNATNITSLYFESANNWNNQQFYAWICQGSINPSDYNATSLSDGCGDSRVSASFSGIQSGYTHKVVFSTSSLPLMSGLPHYFVIYVKNRFTMRGHYDTNLNNLTYYYYSGIDNPDQLTNQYSVQPHYITYYESTSEGLDDLDIFLQYPGPFKTVGLSTPTFKGLFRDDLKQANFIRLVIQNQADPSLSVSSDYSLASTTNEIRIKNFETGSSLGVELGLVDVSVPISYSAPGTSTWTAMLLADDVVISTTNPESNEFYISQYGSWEENFNKETICASDDLDTILGQVSCALKLAFSWTVYPSPSSIDGIKNAGNAIKKDFPFSMYFDLIDQIRYLATSTEQISPSFRVPTIDKNKNIEMTEIISSSTVSEYVGEGNNNLIRLTIGWLIWSAVAYAIYLEIKKI